MVLQSGALKLMLTVFASRMEQPVSAGGGAGLGKGRRKSCFCKKLASETPYDISCARGRLRSCWFKRMLISHVSSHYRAECQRLCGGQSVAR